MNELQIFNYNKQKIRTVQRDGETWWVLKDVCRVLDIKNPTQAMKRLDEDERAMFDIGRSSTTGGGGQTNIINESGLYNIILRSDKPEAKPFRRWVTHEVLPSIRRTGAYGTGAYGTGADIALMAKLVAENVTQSVITTLAELGLVTAAPQKKRNRTRDFCQIETFPAEIQQLIQEMLEDKRITYQEISFTVTAKGYQISRSAVGRYAKKLEREKQ